MDFPAPLPVPEIEITEPLLSRAGVRLLVRREDLNHPEISGNKYWKLKYNLQEAAKRGFSTILTFGGAYSNHIAATAAACKLCGFKSIGIIRGEDADPENPTLATARKNGMLMQKVSRAAYRLKTTEAFADSLCREFGDFYMVPEGGTNGLAIAGAKEMVLGINSAFDYLCLPVGTGGTIAGCIQALEGRKHVLGFAALKGDFLAGEVKQLHEIWKLPLYNNWHIEGGYHCGGYGKVTLELTGFMAQFERAHGVPLDHVYTGKMMLGIYKMIEKGFFSKGTTVLALHTGGLQGRKMTHLR